LRNFQQAVVSLLFEPELQTRARWKGENWNFLNYICIWKFDHFLYSVLASKKFEFRKENCL
jgi:hypothetical protein